VSCLLLLLLLLLRRCYSLIIPAVGKPVHIYNLLMKGDEGGKEGGREGGEGL